MATKDRESGIGNAGETQQFAEADQAVLTSNFGAPLSDNQNSLRIGERGPTLLEDFILREKIFHFDHERIPERIVHARGSAAHGYFECTDPIPDLCCASLFAENRRKRFALCDQFLAQGAFQFGNGYRHDELSAGHSDRQSFDPDQAGIVRNQRTQMRLVGKVRREHITDEERLRL